MQRYRTKFTLTVSVVILVCIASFLVFDTIDYTGKYATVDLAQYRVMAQAAPSLAVGTVPAPFAYRIAAPWFAGMLSHTGIPEPLSFRILTLLCIALLLYRIGINIQQTCSTTISILMMCWLAFSPFAFGFCIFNYFQLCDVLTLLLLLLALESLRTFNPLTFALTSSLAVLTREHAMILVLVVVVWMFLHRSQTKSMLLAIMPMLAVFIVLRLVVTPLSTDWSLLGSFLDYLHKLWSPEAWFRVVITSWSPFGPAILLLLVRKEVRNQLLPHEWLFITLNCCAVLVAKDTERMMLPALLVLTPVFARVLAAATLPVWMIVLFFACTVANAMHPLYVHWSPLTKVQYYALNAGMSMAVAFLVTRFVRSGNHREERTILSS
ncbi:MAG: hypothetical protein JNL32_06125 [Candidatus Kapabacteria bacterium]|nr:hypothetical protein [Candidatus Kapabacteria bacterium]